MSTSTVQPRRNPTIAQQPGRHLSELGRRQIHNFRELMRQFPDQAELIITITADPSASRGRHVKLKFPQHSDLSPSAAL